MQEYSDTVFANVFEPVRDPDQACLLGSDDSNETLTVSVALFQPNSPLVMEKKS